MEIPNVKAKLKLLSATTTLWRLRWRGSQILKTGLTETQYNDSIAGKTFKVSVCFYALLVLGILLAVPALFYS